MNTAHDLEELVKDRLLEAVAGQRLDMKEDSILLPHLLGIVEVGGHYHYKDKEGTILEHDHEFWDDYEAMLLSNRAVADEIDRTIRRLVAEGEIHLVGLSDDELRIHVTTEDSPDVTCEKCGEEATATQNLVKSTGTYYVKLVADCRSCDATEIYKHNISNI